MLVYFRCYACHGCYAYVFWTLCIFAGAMHVYSGAMHVLTLLEEHPSHPNGRAVDQHPLECDHATEVMQNRNLDQVHTMYPSCCKPLEHREL